MKKGKALKKGSKKHSLPQTTVVNIDPIYTDVSNYLHGYVQSRMPLKPGLNHTHKKIKQRIHKKNIFEKVHAVSIIGQAIQDAKKKKDPAINSRITRLKSKLTPKESNHWKTHLLTPDTRFIPHRYFSDLDYNADVLQAFVSLTNGKRFKSPLKFSSTNNYYALTGSTFFTNRENLLRQQSLHVLDATLGAVTQNNIVLALGDGCGGHFGDTAQDRAIARTAYFTCKHSIRLLSAYTDPEALKKDIPQLIPLIAKEVKLKSGSYRESTTIVAGRTYQKRNQKQRRFIGFNIGDSMMIAWSPETNQLTTLLPAHVKLLEGGTRPATANFPQQTKNEIHQIDTEISSDCVLIALSDGIYDHLPCTRTKHRYQDGCQYQKITLNAEELTPRLTRIPKNASVENIIKTLTNITIININLKKEQRIREVEENKSKLPDAKITLEKKLKAIKLKEEKNNLKWEQLTTEKNVETISKEDLQAIDQQLKIERTAAIAEYQEIEAKTQIQMGDDVTIAGYCIPSPTRR